MKNVDVVPWIIFVREGFSSYDASGGVVELVFAVSRADPHFIQPFITPRIFSACAKSSVFPDFSWSRWQWQRRVVESFQRRRIRRRGIMKRSDSTTSSNTSLLILSRVHVEINGQRVNPAREIRQIVFIIDTVSSRGVSIEEYSTLCIRLFCIRRFKSCSWILDILHCTPEYTPFFLFRILDIRHGTFNFGRCARRTVLNANICTKCVPPLDVLHFRWKLSWDCFRSCNESWFWILTSER